MSAIAIIQKLGAQNSRRELALNNMLQGLCMFDGQHRLVVWNRQYQTMYKIDARTFGAAAAFSELLELRKAVGTLPPHRGSTNT